jgi:hypothetical protein
MGDVADLCRVPHPALSGKRSHRTQENHRKTHDRQSANNRVLFSKKTQAFVRRMNKHGYLSEPFSLHPKNKGIYDGMILLCHTYASRGCFCLGGTNQNQWFGKCIDLDARHPVTNAELSHFGNEHTCCTGASPSITTQGPTCSSARRRRVSAWSGFQLPTS